MFGIVGVWEWRCIRVAVCENCYVCGALRVSMSQHVRVAVCASCGIYGEFGVWSSLLIFFPFTIYISVFVNSILLRESIEREEGQRRLDWH
mgnify:CR=1 FL=1